MGKARCDCGECNTCVRRADRHEYYLANKEHISKMSAAYHEKHRERNLARMRERYYADLENRRKIARERARAKRAEKKAREESVEFVAKVPDVDVQFVLGQGWIAVVGNQRFSGPDKMAVIQKAQAAALAQLKIEERDG